VEAHNGGAKDKILVLCKICNGGLTGIEAWEF
jgi:hypothetical protein